MNFHIGLVPESVSPRDCPNFGSFRMPPLPRANIRFEYEKSESSSYCGDLDQLYDIELNFGVNSKEEFALNRGRNIHDDMPKDIEPR